MEPPNDGVSIVIPCYNEENAIVPVLDQIESIMAASGLAYEVVVVDDGSSDATADKVDTARFALIRHELNRGYGAALKTGVRRARYDLIVITDADGTYPNEQIPALVAAAQEADMVVGSRTGEHVKVPLIRKPAKWAITQLANYLSGHAIPDLNSGLRVIRRSLWERYERFFPDGFSLTTTITLAALTNGHRVKYIPINYHHRVGQSKIKPIRDTINFTKLIVRTILYFDPLKVFLPLSFYLFLAAMLIGGGSLFIATFFDKGEFLDVTTLLLFVTSLQMLAIGALADLITKRMQ